MWTVQEAASPRPVCSNCQRRKELCDYTLEYGTVTVQAVVPAVTPGSGESFRPPTQASISAALAASRSSPQPSLVLQESLINIVRWFEADCEPPRAMVPTPYLESFEFKPQYSSNPHIFHYLIPHVAAVSTLRALLRGAASRDPAQLASAYHANVAASAAFRAVERAVTDANWPSILLFTLCNLMFNFAAAAHFAAPPHFDYLEVFQRVLRGTGGVRTQLLRRLLRLGIILGETPSPPLPAPRLDAETEAALERLASARHPAAAAPPATVAACAEALALLRRWARVVGGRPTQWAHFFHWPCAVSPAFVAALAERQPVATLIFVHWCAVMRRAPDVWFLDGWARRTAFAAVAAIAPAADYCDLLRWPMSVFGGLTPSPQCRS
ncbi:hypothetical protein F4824DRAFT_500778 [Ustulina deusta]|nr:hypothetical protein F4824DRAFT_500778 [Ustulina deusta]